MMTEQYRKAMLCRMTPQPRSFVLGEGHCILNDGAVLTITTEQPLTESEAALIRKAISRFPGFDPVPELTVSSDLNSFGPEKYTVSVTDRKIRIRARSCIGVKYAFDTLRQLAEPVRGTMILTNEMLPCCEIEDEPALPFRAIHLCIFPETSMTTILKNVRMAAYHKYNYVIIESWGVFPFKSHPEFAWKTMVKPEAEFRLLRYTAKECGITIIPQFNIFGHAPMSRVASAKHAVLDEHPELEPLFEPGGWSFCLSNEHTRKIIADLVTELHEFYGNPEFFHIGCDEAYDFQTCSDCASADGSRLICDHISRFRDLFAGRGARVIMWHDMLLDKDDPRWNGYVALGSAESAGMIGLLPKDVIIADWQYGGIPENAPDGEWQTYRYLKENGFCVVGCPWQNMDGSLVFCRMAQKYGMPGIIQTTWHTAYTHNYRGMFSESAHFAWTGKAPENLQEVFCCERDIRHVCQDMGVTDYEEFGHTLLQIGKQAPN